MTVLTSRSSYQYTTDGTSNVFAFPAPFIDPGDLVVQVEDTLGYDVATTLNGTSGFGYRLIGTQDAESGEYIAGADVVFAAVPAPGYIVTLYRDPPVTQTLALVSGGRFTAESINTALDKLTMIAQRDRDALSRTLSHKAWQSFWDAQGLPIRNLGDPVLSADAANKTYVDGKVIEAAEGLPVATKAMAEAGLESGYVMTPERTRQAIEARQPAVLLMAKDWGFVADDATHDNAPHWNAVMDAIAAAAYPSTSELILAGTYYFKTPPKQIPSNLTVRGGGYAAPAVLVRAYAPCANLAITGTLLADFSGRTIILSGTLVSGDVITLTIAGELISRTVSGDDTLGSIVDIMIAGVNANVVLQGHAITAKKMLWNDTAFGLCDAGGTGLAAYGVSITSDPHSNLTLRTPVRITCPGHTVVSGQTVGVYGVAGTTEANGMWTAGAVGSGFIDLVGSVYTNAYVSGGHMLDDPMAPFIKLGPTGPGDHYSFNPSLEYVTILAGANAIGGVGLWVGSYDLTNGEALPGSTLRGHFGTVYNARCSTLFISTSTLAGAPEWWISAVYDGSKSTGGNAPGDVGYLPGDTPHGFQGVRDCKMVQSALYAGVYAGLVVRAAENWRGTGVDVFGRVAGPSIKADTLLSGTWSNPNNLCYLIGTTVTNLLIDHYGGLFSVEGAVATFVARETAIGYSVHTFYQTADATLNGVGGNFFGPWSLETTGLDASSGYRLATTYKWLVYAAGLQVASFSASGIGTALDVVAGGAIVAGGALTGQTLRIGGGATIARVLKLSVGIDWPNLASLASQDIDVTVTGAQVGDLVVLTPPAGFTASLVFTAWVVALNTVRVRMHNVSSGAYDPPSGTFQIAVFGLA